MFIKSRVSFWFIIIITIITIGATLTNVIVQTKITAEKTKLKDSLKGIEQDSLKVHMLSN